MAHPTVYEIITSKIIEKLEAGTVPWHKPWSGGSGLAARNFTSKHVYRGMNTILTNMQGYSSEYWGTIKQISKAGGKVNKGEKATQIIFWKFLDGLDANGEAKQIPMLRYYNVFNLEQTTGVDYERPIIEEQKEFRIIESCEKILDNLPIGKPRLVHQQQRACYFPLEDKINMPKKETFEKNTEYYSVLFHELGHATGHENRLKRAGIMDRHAFGSCDYSKEELVAEITASFMNGAAGILHETVDNSTAYIQSWLRKFKDDPKMIVQAAGKAQKAADYLLNVK